MRYLYLSTLLFFLSAATTDAAQCDSTFKGYSPLTELISLYKGQSGGLYPGGLNLPPASHDSIGRALANQFVPLDTLGQQSSSGVWVLLSIGMSNCTQEFSQFISSLTGDTTLHPRLRIIDGAQGGQTAARIKYDTATFWNVIGTRLRSRGLSPNQVQAVWLKEANAGPTQAFPTHALMLRDDLRDVVQVAKNKYPNLRQLFFSSRTYGGYASTPLNPEPYAYESAFSYRWLVEAQLNGNDSLNFKPDSGEVKAAWMAWGPYLWADGVIPRELDSLQWFCNDFTPSDGTHPSASGRIKVANLLESFFKTSPYTVPWFLKTAPSDYVCGDTDDNGAINIADVVFLVQYIFGGGSPPNPIETGDLNCSDMVNITDVVYFIQYIFNSGPGPCASCP